MDQLRAVLRKHNELMLLGSELARDNKNIEEGPHLQLVRVDVTTGKTMALDLTAESLQQDR